MHVLLGNQDKVQEFIVGFIFLDESVSLGPQQGVWLVPQSPGL